MYKELIINDAGFETRVALLEDGVLVELYIERGDEADIVGNIYRGRVLRVLPGMQAAFVDIGLPQAAFLYVDDVVADISEEKTGEIPPEPEPDPEEGVVPDAPRKKASIEELITEGEHILVQVAKSPIGNKGARVTSRIGIPGRFLVIMPASTHVGVSRRITDEAERNRLRTGIMEMRRDPYGFIIRTAAAGEYPDKLAQEMEFLTRLWKRIQKRFSQASGPGVLYRELSASLKAVRDLFTQEVDKLVVDSQTGYQEILDFVEPFMPSLADAVEHYQKAEPIFDAYHLESEISRLFRKKIWLKSGGYIVIEGTEALVAVDVNTGRYVGKGDLSETILKTNLEALKEIAYQLRLRDIGGIIVIDFIDMEKPEDREKVRQALEIALSKDRSTTNVVPMSELGLIQMTRKRTRENLNRKLSEPCFYCDGHGTVLSKKTVCHNIFRQIMRQAADMEGQRLSLNVHPEVAQFLLEEENLTVMNLEKTIGRQILIRADDKLHMERFDLIEIEA